MSTYRYTAEQKAQALILLAANRGNLPLTAGQIGVAPDTLKAWATSEHHTPSQDIGKGMEAAISYLLGEIPNLVNKYNIGELLGTLLEKWLHYQGIPQTSTQTILAVLATKSDAQIDRMITDIDQGKQLRLNHQDQIIDVERSMRELGMVGLDIADQPKTLKLPDDVNELIEYHTSDDREDDTW